MLSVKHVPKCLGKLQTLDRLGEEEEEENSVRAVVDSVVVVAVNNI